MGRNHKIHTIENVTWIHGSNPETKLGAQSRALSQSTLKFTTSTSMLSSGAEANTNYTLAINDILKEIQDSTENLITQIRDLRENILKP